MSTGCFLTGNSPYSLRGSDFSKKTHKKTVEIYGILKNKILEMKARRKGGGEAQSDGASEEAADKSAPAEETQPSDGEEIKN